MYLLFFLFTKPFVYEMVYLKLLVSVQGNEGARKIVTDYAGYILDNSEEKVFKKQFQYALKTFA